MIDAENDNPTRRALRGALKLLVLAGVLAVIYAFGQSFFRTDGEGAVPNQFTVDASGLAPGEALRVEWAGRRYLVLHRSPEMLAALDASPAKLKDADSRRSQQPEAARNAQRSLEPRYLVVLAFDTLLNCDLDVVAPQAVDVDGWGGGLRDRCGKHRYDFAGRILAADAAPRNLVVPAYRVEGTRIILLED